MRYTLYLAPYNCKKAACGCKRLFLLGEQFQGFVVDGGQNFCIQALVEGNLIPGFDMAQNLNWHPDGKGILPLMEEAWGGPLPR